MYDHPALQFKEMLTSLWSPFWKIRFVYLGYNCFQYLWHWHCKCQKENYFSPVAPVCSPQFLEHLTKLPISDHGLLKRAARSRYYWTVSSEVTAWALLYCTRKKGEQNFLDILCTPFPQYSKSAKVLGFWPRSKLYLIIKEIIQIRYLKQSI